MPSTDQAKKQSNKSRGSTASRGPKKKAQKVQKGKVHILCSFNNTKITVTDDKGNVLACGSAGRHFKGSRKSTPFAAQTAGEETFKKAYENNGLREVDVEIKGPGPGREATIRALQTVGIVILFIKDVTGIPHNGCRPPKKRRV